MIKAVIFDMDGLLIDSEPLWREASVAVFQTVGITILPEMSRQTMGMRIDQVAEYWFDRFPWTGPTPKEVADQILHEVIRLVEIKGAMKKGVLEVLDFVQSKPVKVALASSSSLVLIEAVLQKFGIRDRYVEVYSAEFEEHGKPHPGVYLTAAKMLDIPAVYCLAFEDSFNGILAAKSARMKCVAVPDPELQGSPKLSIADVVLHSLDEMNDTVWNELNS